VVDEVVFNGIERSPWFAGLSDDALESLAEICSIKSYQEAETVYSFGEQREHLYGVLTGSVRVSITADRQQHYSLIDFHEDSWFGESALLVNQSKVITITPLETTELLVLPAKSVVEIADLFPCIYKNMYIDKLRSMQLFYNMVSGLLTYPLKARMAMKLLPIIEERGISHNDGAILNPCLSLVEWARVSMGSQQRVTLIFDEWVTEGIIEHYEGGWFFPNISELKKEVHC